MVKKTSRVVVDHEKDVTVFLEASSLLVGMLGLLFRGKC